MATKLQAVAAATKAGIETLIVHGRKTKQITRALAGEDVGTRFLAAVEIHRDGRDRRSFLNSK